MVAWAEPVANNRSHCRTLASRATATPESARARLLVIAHAPMPDARGPASRRIRVILSPSHSASRTTFPDMSEFWFVVAFSCVATALVLVAVLLDGPPPR